MPVLEQLRSEVEAHSGQFRCSEIHQEKNSKTVQFQHVATPPGDSSTVPDVPGLSDFYCTFGELTLYLEEQSGDAAYFLASPSQWQELESDFRPWLEGIGQEETDEYLPDWTSDCIVIGEIPRSGNYLLVPTAGPEAGKVIEFEHDGFEFIELGTSLADFVALTGSRQQPAWRRCHVRPQMLLGPPLDLPDNETSGPIERVESMKTIRLIALAALLCAASLLHAEPSIQVGFSPEGSARKLVLETIGSAKQSIRMLAYAFQAQDIAQALVAAKQRGVDVRIVVDKKRNEGKTSKAAMDFVTRNGVELRTNSHFNMHHDKTIIVDGNAVQTGSFNFAASAETVNSENVVVIRDDPEVARRYIAHWQSRWELGKPYAAR